MGEEARRLFDVMLGDADDEKSLLRLLMEDKFGNYTVQAMIKFCRGDALSELEKRIRAVESKLPEGVTKKNILDVLETRLSQGTDGPPLVPADGLPSVGSMFHASGTCKPCAWFWKPASCQNGKNCQHCHLCPEGELKDRKRAKKGGN